MRDMAPSGLPNPMLKRPPRLSRVSRCSQVPGRPPLRRAVICMHGLSLELQAVERAAACARREVHIHRGHRPPSRVSHSHVADRLSPAPSLSLAVCYTLYLKCCLPSSSCDVKISLHRSVAHLSCFILQPFNMPPLILELDEWAFPQGRAHYPDPKRADSPMSFTIMDDNTTPLTNPDSETSLSSQTLSVASAFSFQLPPPIYPRPTEKRDTIRTGCAPCRLASWQQCHI